jgi:type III pantothenate kinase
MMLLAIDIGNTNSVFALYDAAQTLCHVWRCRTERVRTADEYAAFLHPLLIAHDLNWADIQAAIISCVVPEAGRFIEQFCKTYPGHDPVFVTPDMVEVLIDLDNPDEVGADRIVNAAAVIKHYQCPAVVIDFGTATTFDVIDQNGAYAGGAIAPGINLSMAALHSAAAKLPSVPIERPPVVIGKNTVHAMQSGVFYGYVSMIEGMLSRLAADMNIAPADLRVIATGGLALVFADHIPMIDTVDDELTLKGLLEVYHQTRTST